jgi:hypothetical protein
MKSCKSSRDSRAWLAVAFSWACIVSGCQRNHGSDTSASPPQRGVLLQSPPTRVASYSPNELLALLTGNDLGKVLLKTAYSPSCSVSVYHIEYETVDPAGSLTPASGALMVPSGSAGCQGGRPVLLYGHGTSTDRAYDISTLSAGENGEGLVLAAIFAAHGYIVVAPNYVGYDTSTLDYHPFLDADQQSKDMIDALTAARSALPVGDAPDTADGGKLFVSGYSEGGHVAVATQRAMQTAGMLVTAAAPMSGPYALSAFVDAVFEGHVNASAVPNFVMLVSSYQHAYGNVYANATDIFAASYADEIDMLLPGASSLSELSAQHKLPAALFDSTPPSPGYAAFTPAIEPAALAPIFAQGIGTDFLVTNDYRSGYLKDEAAAPDGGFPSLTSDLPPASPGNALRRALKLNDLRNWSPSTPVLLCGGGSDPTVFFSNTQLMQGYWADHPPTSSAAVLDVDSTLVSGDPYGELKTGFAAAVALVRAAAVAGGATDGGDAAVLADYHAGLVPPFCFLAAKSFFDEH